MSYKIFLSEGFQKRAKRLSKKFPSLKEELLKLIENLENNPLEGISMGNGFYKIRLAVKSKGTGKRGGLRVVTYVYIIKKSVVLFTIYDKSEQTDVTDKELKAFLNELPDILED